MVEFVAAILNAFAFATTSEYFEKTGAISIVQFGLLATVTHLVLAHSVLFFVTRFVGRPVGEPERIATSLVESLATLCAATGLILTFSGLYGDIAAGQSGDRWSLLLALGSSAIGYSGLAVCAIGWSVDQVLRGTQEPMASAAVPSTPGKSDE